MGAQGKSGRSEGAHACIVCVLTSFGIFTYVIHFHGVSSQPPVVVQHFLNSFPTSWHERSNALFIVSILSEREKNEKYYYINIIGYFCIVSMTQHNYLNCLISCYQFFVVILSIDVKITVIQCQCQYRCQCLSLCFSPCPFISSWSWHTCRPLGHLVLFQWWSDHYLRGIVASSCSSCASSRTVWFAEERSGDILDYIGNLRTK